MATVDFAAKAARATRMIERWGSTATLYKRTRTGDQMNPAIEDVPYPVRAARSESAKWDNESGGTIRKEILYVSAQEDAVPADLDKLRFAGVDYVLSRVEALDSTGANPVYFKVMATTT